MSYRPLRLLILAAVLPLIIARVRAEEPKAPASKDDAAKAASQETRGKFLRVLKDKENPVALQTSVARYVSAGTQAAGVAVDLVSAVHVGEKAYYAALNKAFADYDVVLYELVAEEGTRVPKGGGESRGVVSGLQNGLKGMLGLEFQLNEVDYTKENFVHADMSPDEFTKAMARRGESIWGMLFRMMGHAMAQQANRKGGPSDLEMLIALLRQDPLHLKRIMAEQFENLEFVTTALSGAEGSTLIEGRNAAALAVLKKQIERGNKKIAIFYGAGHMPDMEKRLVNDFKLKFDGERWLEAWDLRDKKQDAPRRSRAAVKRVEPAASATK